MTEYDKMRVKELKETYLERARELNSEIDRYQSKGELQKEVDRIDTTNIPSSKHNLVIKILEMDVRLAFPIRGEDNNSILIMGGIE